MRRVVGRTWDSVYDEAEDPAMIPHRVAAINGNTDMPLWLLILKRLEVRLSLWLEYRFWPAAMELFRDRSEIARKLAHAGWVIGTVAMLYLLAHLLVAMRRGWL